MPRVTSGPKHRRGQRLVKALLDRHGPNGPETGQKRLILRQARLHADAVTGIVVAEHPHDRRISGRRVPVGEPLAERFGLHVGHCAEHVAALGGIGVDGDGEHGDAVGRRQLEEGVDLRPVGRVRVDEVATSERDVPVVVGAFAAAEIGAVPDEVGDDRVEPVGLPVRKVGGLVR